MKRMFATSSLALVVFASAACKRDGAVDPIKLIPDGATAMGGVDVKAVVGSKAYQDNKAMVEQGEGKEELEAARACQLGPETWQSVLVGLDTAAPDTKTALVLRATGLGKRENLDCIAGKMKAAQGKDPWTMEEKNGRLTLAMTEGNYTGFVVDDDTVAVAGSGWVEAMQAVLAGGEQAKSAVDGSLKDLVARVDKQQIWLVGRIPEGMAQPPVDGAKDASVSIDLTQGLAIVAAVGFPTPQDAQTKAEALSAQYGQLKGVIAGAGIPQSVLDGVKIEPKESTVRVSLTASAEDVDTLSKQAAALVGGLQ